MSRFYAGDVLYSRLRPYLNKVWRADREGLCSSELIVLPGNDAIDPDFLRYRRDKVNLDIFWLKDDSLEESANLPAPDVIAAEIAADLEAALEQCAAIAEDRKA